MSHINFKALKKNKTKLLYKTNRSFDDQWFVIRTVCKNKAKLNFWVFTLEHNFLYTIVCNEEYNQKTEWTDEVCQKLLNELRSEKPNISVVRYCVDDKVVISANNNNEYLLPTNPLKRYPDLPVKIYKREKIKRRYEIEDALQKIDAPYILFGKHSTLDKEYAWKLTPDKPKRQGIVPGDKVVVWTKNGFRTVTVTRIEDATGKEQPLCRVKKKIKD